MGFFWVKIHYGLLIELSDYWVKSGLFEAYGTKRVYWDWGQSGVIRYIGGVVIEYIMGCYWVEIIILFKWLYWIYYWNRTLAF